MRSFGRDSMMNGFMMSNGAMGKIVSINLPTFVVLDRDNIEKVILIDNNTSIRESKTIATTTDLKVDDLVVIFGLPNTNAQIEAKLIRIMKYPFQKK
jgi:hypothetical protein